jgi:hypothetical protein
VSGANARAEDDVKAERVEFEASTAHTNADAHTAHTNADAHTAHTNADAHTAHTNADARTAHSESSSRDVPIASARSSVPLYDAAVLSAGGSEAYNDTNDKTGVPLPDERATAGGTAIHRTDLGSTTVITTNITNNIVYVLKQQ